MRSFITFEGTPDSVCNKLIRHCKQRWKRRQSNIVDRNTHFCSSTTESSKEDCNLDAYYTFNFEQAQYYALPTIDFSFSQIITGRCVCPNLPNKTSTITRLRESTMLKRIPFYFVLCPSNDRADSGGSGVNALIYRSVKWPLEIHGWPSEKIPWTVGGWIMEGTSKNLDFVIVKLVKGDTLSNSILIELQMRAPQIPSPWSRKNVWMKLESFKVYL